MRILAPGLFGLLKNQQEKALLNRFSKPLCQVRLKVIFKVCCNKLLYDLRNHLSLFTNPVIFDVWRLFRLQIILDMEWV